MKTCPEKTTIFPEIYDAICDSVKLRPILCRFDNDVKLTAMEKFKRMQMNFTFLSNPTWSLLDFMIRQVDNENNIKN